MVREIVHDPLMLTRKSEEATAGDAQEAADLMDTLIAHRDRCVGMAATIRCVGLKE